MLVSLVFAVHGDVHLINARTWHHLRARNTSLIYATKRHRMKVLRIKTRHVASTTMRRPAQSPSRNELTHSRSDRRSFSRSLLLLLLRPYSLRTWLCPQTSIDSRSTSPSTNSDLRYRAHRFRLDGHISRRSFCGRLASPNDTTRTVGLRGRYSVWSQRRCWHSGC